MMMYSAKQILLLSPISVLFVILPNNYLGVMAIHKHFRDSLQSFKRRLFGGEVRFNQLLSFAFVLVYQQMTYYGLDTENVLKLVYSLDPDTKNHVLLRSLVNRLNSLVEEVEVAITTELRENWIDYYQLDILSMKYRIIPFFYRVFEEKNEDVKLEMLILELSSMSSLLQHSFENLAMDYKDFIDMLNSKNELSLNFLNMDSSLELLHYNGLYEAPISLPQFINLITMNLAEIDRHNRIIILKLINEIDSSLDCFFELSNFLEKSYPMKKNIHSIEEFQTTLGRIIDSCDFLNSKILTVKHFKEFRYVSHKLNIKSIRLQLLIKNLCLVFTSTQSTTTCKKRYHLLIDSMCMSTLNYIKT